MGKRNSEMGFKILTTLLFCTQATLANQTGPQRTGESSTEALALSLWEQILGQRGELEAKSKEQGAPLREILNPEEFKKKYPLLPQNKQLESAPLAPGIEIRIATIPKNLSRAGADYSMVAILYHNKKGELEKKYMPKDTETLRVLNITSDWSGAKKILDHPIIKNK
jgi:hypothetical protein